MKERITVRVESATEEYVRAVADNADVWVPACGGHEIPFIHNGTEWLYVWNPATGEHGYLNIRSDRIEEDFS